MQRHSYDVRLGFWLVDLHRVQEKVSQNVFITSFIKLGRFWLKLLPTVLNKFTTKCCKHFPPHSCCDRSVQLYAQRILRRHTNRHCRCGHVLGGLRGGWRQLRATEKHVPAAVAHRLHVHGKRESWYHRLLRQLVQADHGRRGTLVRLHPRGPLEEGDVLWSHRRTYPARQRAWTDAHRSADHGTRRQRRVRSELTLSYARPAADGCPLCG